MIRDGDGADGGDDVDDDPDDARREDDDDGDDFPLWHGISPAKSPRQEGLFFPVSFLSQRDDGEILQSGSPMFLGHGGKYAKGEPEVGPRGPTCPPGAA